jgi:type II secretory pathway component PulC
VIDATHFEVDRKLVETLKGDPKQAGAMARPVVKEGKMQGVRLFAVRSSGLAHAMGLRNGDTLMAANGVKLESYEAALELMGRLQTKDHWSVDIERRGGPLTLSIDLQ